MIFNPLLSSIIHDCVINSSSMLCNTSGVFPNDLKIMGFILIKHLALHLFKFMILYNDFKTNTRFNFSLQCPCCAWYWVWSVQQTFANRGFHWSLLKLIGWRGCSERFNWLFATALYSSYSKRSDFDWSTCQATCLILRATPHNFCFHS